MIHLIKRTQYIESVLPFVDQPIVKIIVGQRRVGKSYLLLQLMEHLKLQNPGSNNIYINKEYYEFDAIRNYHDLMQYIADKTDQAVKNYIFIDEIQEISEFEKAIRSLYGDPRYDVYITGSNANLLSRELATLLSGRYIEFRVNSLSYGEFLKFHELPDSHDSLMKYLQFGGLPYLIHLNLEEEIVYGYLRSIYNGILLKDVIARFQLRNVKFIENLVHYLADNIGNLTTAKRISDFLKSQNIRMSPNIVLNYLNYLQSAFFIHKASRIDIKGRKIFEINDKYYFEDLGLRHMLIGYRQSAINQILENLVFKHLQFCGYKIFVGQLPNQEIDFVAEKADKRLYIQVCYLITDEKVRQREFGNLMAIRDNYPKYVVSMDETAGGSEKGIQHLSIRRFLLNNW